MEPDFTAWLSSGRSGSSLVVVKMCRYARTILLSLVLCLTLNIINLIEDRLLVRTIEKFNALSVANQANTMST
jgi:hypothetical protein